MTRVDPADLARLLEQPTLRIRTGILLVPLNALGSESELAARLGVEAVDFREWKLTRAGTNSRYLGLSAETILRDLQEVVEDVDLGGTCLWIHNMDLFLSALRYDERLRTWAALFSTFKQRRGLLFSMPAQALNLLPATERGTWERDERLATWEGA